MVSDGFLALAPQVIGAPDFDRGASEQGELVGELVVKQVLGHFQHRIRNSRLMQLFAEQDKIRNMNTTKKLNRRSHSYS